MEDLLDDLLGRLQLRSDFSAGIGSLLGAQRSSILLIAIFAVLQYSAEMSNPMPFILVRWQATNVDPLPTNGSTTSEPVGIPDILIHISGSATGKIAGWL